MVADVAYEFLYWLAVIFLILGIISFAVWLASRR
jgi:hypothetical protein